jgi:hypothetical protein
MLCLQNNATLGWTATGRGSPLNGFLQEPDAYARPQPAGYEPQS